MNKEKVQAAMDDLKVKQDLFLLSKLEKEYNELSDKCNKLYTFIYSLDFKEKVPDSNEQCLLQEQHKRMEAYRTNLYQRIDFYRARVKREESIKDWSQYKKTDSTYIGVDVSDEGSHSECCQVGGDAIATHHCGNDADMDDACCQAAYDPNESQPVDTKPAITGESLKKLVGWQVVSVMPPGHKCQGCLYSSDDFRCEKKVELVGGYFLCLAPLPNSIVTE